MPLQTTISKTFSTPNFWGVAWGGNDLIVGTDWQKHQVCVIRAADGSVVRQFGSQGNRDGQFNYPQYVAIHPHTNTILVTCRNGIQEFSMNGKFVRKIGSVGSGPHQYTKYLQGIAVSRQDGSVYVADQDGNKVVVYAASGAHVRSFGSRGKGQGQFNCPLGIALDEEDNIYVCDYSNNRVQVLSRGGEFLRMFGSHGEQPGQFDRPTQIGMERGGERRVAVRCCNGVQVFGRDGTFVGKLRQFDEKLDLGIPASGFEISDGGRMAVAARNEGMRVTGM